MNAGFMSRNHWVNNIYRIDSTLRTILAPNRGAYCLHNVNVTDYTNIITGSSAKRPYSADTVASISKTLIKLLSRAFEAHVGN